MLEIQKYLQNHSLNELSENFGILVKEYDDRIVLNYKIDSTPKFHPIVCECRNLILSLPDYKVLSRSFDRFFNYGEGDDYKTFNWKNAKYYNKLDGSLISLYNDGKKWCVSTKGTAFAESTTPMGKTYFELFTEAINGMDLQKFCELLNKNVTFIFELTSPYNRIVTRYENTKITLLSARLKDTGTYLSEEFLIDGLDYFRHPIELVESYEFNTVEEVLKFVESRSQMDEGVVCFDETTQKRIKIKNSSYVSLHHLRGNEVTIKSILTLLLKKEEDEYFTYFEEDQEIFKPYMEKFYNLKNEVENVFNELKDIEDQKSFALKAKKYNFSGILFSMKKGLTVDDIFDIKNLNQILKFFK